MLGGCCSLCASSFLATTAGKQWAGEILPPDAVEWYLHLGRLWTDRWFFPSLDFLCSTTMEVAGRRLQSGWQVLMGSKSTESHEALLLDALDLIHQRLDLSSSGTRRGNDLWSASLPLFATSKHVIFLQLRQVLKIFTDQILVLPQR